ncbi:hypothetical protein [Burkholderia ubonensis]|uniref:hypothetical protein n=1 Tax=Burkholderia ubonensis TaxID=101571 RepID=UPI0012F93C59|nr:hypothetical protein [Burkholderia ubonensis]
MRAIFSAWMVGSIFYGVAVAHPAPKEGVIVANNLNLLREQCGYSLDKSIVSRVESSESSVEGDIFRIYFKLKIVPINRPMFAILSFGCQSPVPDSLEDDGKARVTAREEIAEEDSGGVTSGMLLGKEILIIRILSEPSHTLILCLVAAWGKKFRDIL